MLQIFCGFHTFCAALENVPLGSVFKLPGRKKNTISKLDEGYTKFCKLY